MIVAEVERGEAEPLVGAHCATVKDKDPLARVVVTGRLAQPVIIATGAEAGEFFVTYGRVKRRRRLSRSAGIEGALGAPLSYLGHLRWLAGARSGVRGQRGSCRGWVGDWACDINTPLVF